MGEYYVIRDKNTGLYFRGKGVNRWGKHYNQASIYRVKGMAEHTVKEVSWRGEQAEIIPIQIIENTADVVPKSEYDAVVSAVDNSTKEFLKLHDYYQEAKRTVKRWIFENSPFEMLDIAFNRLFPNVKYTAFFEPNIRDNEHGEKVCGFTDFDDEGKITIFIDTDLSINDAVEIFAHELAHAGVGVEQEHNERWQKAFDDLFDEYNKIGDEMFGSNIDAPKGESYSNALSEIDKIKCNFAREIFEDIENRLLPSNTTGEFRGDSVEWFDYYDLHLAEDIAELKKKYTEDKT